MTFTIKAAVLYTLIATIMGPTGALADDLSPSKVVAEITLDIDRDGKMDRAMLVRNGESASVDLYIYLGTGDGPIDVSRKPTILKKNIASGAAAAIDGDGDGSLILSYGCGGCSNDSETKLRIVYRSGKVLIGRYTLDWDTRSGIGRCDINFLTGKGFVTHGLVGSETRIKVRSSPIALSVWSEDLTQKACTF
ncbi:FG-GAP repeat domain-containing protein [Lichenifustis flavocetrariae]|uniref:VCBS repeat-containing protein n=1 Tax=Lichenifustis flavocetrariae TaxID=2949735 RepID=A0AA42CRY3_9HYPH|nr:VCBS repeat-containing protein [Lichenifustis flavocetrariae]MCW6512962.1 VCBS repeat-containing protein [Lichenifustis flavocetrariae]